MANKTLHSLQFPGLSDTYIVPEDAQEFSSESTYAVGEFVTYLGVLYKCTTAVTTAGSWTGATNWSATDVGTELQDTYGPSRPNFSVNNPVMDGSASPGSATTYARSDHVHPSDTSKLDIPENSGTAGLVLTRTASGSIWQTLSSGGEIIAAASNSYSVTLYANSWTTLEQLIATPTGALITSTSDGVLGLSPNATAALVEAFLLAKIIVISLSSSGVVVKALGIVPTINLPCELMIFMKADYYTKDYIDTYMAPLDTPTFIGVPKAPTAAAGTNTTLIATTAFVLLAKRGQSLTQSDDLNNIVSPGWYRCSYTPANVPSSLYMNSWIEVVEVGGIICLFIYPNSQSSSVIYPQYRLYLNNVWSDWVTFDHNDPYVKKSETIHYYTSQAVSAGTNTTIMRIPAGSATDPDINENTVVLDCTFAAPANITSNITWTSYVGYINFVGSCSAATTANVTLGRKGN